MKISYNWLSDYVTIPVELEVASDILTFIGLEVEGVTELFTEFDHLVIGKVLDCYKHNNADKLKVTKVDVGEKVLQIVCGAQNVSKDQFVVVVLPGNTLKTKKGDSIKIKKTKIRGEISEGMICAEDEIGLGGGVGDGIMEITGSPTIGSLAKDWLKINKDYLIEIGLTPNRTDAFSHIGVARDLYTYFTYQGHDTSMTLPDVSKYENQTALSLDLEVKDNNCQKYVGVCLENVSVQESPVWLKNKLIAIGLKPINNVVDVTNFVLHETGNPLHAFDYDHISQSKIIVRKAKSGEKIQTLDANFLELDCNDLVIADNKQALCLAGVIGGINSGVTFETQNVFLESAYFKPESVRKTSKRHAVLSDSSYRFERGVDFNNCEYALKRAALLIKHICNGKIGQEVQFVDKNLSHNKIDFSFDTCTKILGHMIPKNDIKQILKNLGFTILDSNQDHLHLLAPSFRADVYREIDVVEEVLRIYGYNNIPPSKFVKFQPPLMSDDASIYDLKHKIAEFLSVGGFFEIKNNSLIHQSGCTLFDPKKKNNTVKLINPLSQDLLTMRTNMFFSGLETIKYNLNRQMNNLKLFEFGKVYSLDDKQDAYLELEKLTIFSCGILHGDNWHQDAQKTDFFLMKGVVHKIINRFLPHMNFSIQERHNNYSCLNLVYLIDSKKIIEVGEFDSNILSKFGIKQPVYYVDINLDVFIQLCEKQSIQYKIIGKFPSVKRDLSLLIDKSINYLDIESSIKEVSNDLLRDIILFDVYEGEKIKKSEKSYAISFIFNHDKRTLTDKEVDKQMITIYKHLVTKHNLSLRDGELVLN